MAEARALARTGLQCKATPCGGSWQVAGCSADAAQRLLPEAECAGFQHRCRCKVKTAIVPADRL
eukprot:8865939-Alexandrium_andersonii.AAC.1